VKAFEDLVAWSERRLARIGSSVVVRPRGGTPRGKRCSPSRAQAFAQTGEPDVALETLTDAARFSGGENSKTISLRGYILATLGRTVEAREALHALSALARERYVPPYSFALVHAGLGDRDAAFDWLNRAFDARDVNLIFFTVDPKWDSFRADERFTALLERCRFARVGS